MADFTDKTLGSPALALQKELFLYGSQFKQNNVLMNEIKHTSTRRKKKANSKCHKKI